MFNQVRPDYLRIPAHRDDLCVLFHTYIIHEFVLLSNIYVLYVSLTLLCNRGTMVGMIEHHPKLKKAFEAGDETGTTAELHKIVKQINLPEKLETAI